MTAVPARCAEAGDVDTVAALLHRFNLEFDAPTPGPDVIAERLRHHLIGDALLAMVIGSPISGIAVISLRPNVWHDGPVALLDELYVTPGERNRGLGSALLTAVRSECRRRSVEQIEINVDIGDTDARRFYERHGFTAIEPDTGEHALWYHGPVD